MSETESRTTVLAVADIHVHEGAAAEWRNLLDRMCEDADILVFPGDLTRRGLVREAEIMAESLVSLRVPVVAVLGNHDFESGEQAEIVKVLCQAGVHMLDERSLAR